MKLHDEKANRLDVARCLAEANLVNGDLLEILAAWPEDATEDRIRSKIALACCESPTAKLTRADEKLIKAIVELLVPLTWPLEKSDLQMTVNHHRHIPYLQLAQVRYKRGILNHDTVKMLRAAVRVALPSIALPMGDRSSRDEGIIKLLLFFLRNVTMITPPQHLPIEGDENEISRSATIEAFHYQDILALLLTISSNMGEDFNTQDVVLLELLFHLLKGVDIEKLFMNDVQLDTRKTDELKDLLAKEAGMNRDYARSAPTRHNRFGTMIWVKRDDARMSTVSGQDVLMDGQSTLLKMDKTKKWNKPGQRSKVSEMTYNDFDMPVALTASANKHLRAFVEEFLDSGFNPLFNQVRRAIEREAERVLDVHKRQFFYLVSWFLEAECVRRKAAKEALKKRNTGPDLEVDSFALVASVLNQETFITLNRFMQESLDTKEWQDLNAGMRCFARILSTVQEMSESPLDEDQEIAENIQNRIFYEETTHDRIVTILRGYKDQGFGYLNACTELAHVFLRMLERYSKENIDLQVRSRRRARKKKQATRNKDTEEGGTLDQDDVSEAEDMAQAERTSRERKFDFTRFSSRFMSQNCIDTFVAFTKYYNELNVEQLKRAHRFFYRVAFKQEMSVMLFRVDIMALFHKMMKGPGGLDSSNPVYKEWDELVRQLVKRLTRKIEQRPELVVEMLFSKINATVHYLEYGYEKQTIASKPRVPAELEVKGDMTQDDQIGVVVAVLSDQNNSDAVGWVKNVLLAAASERQAWEAAAAVTSEEQGNSDQDKPEAPTAPSISKTSYLPPSSAANISKVVKPDGEPRRIAMFKDNRLRLLMTIVGFELLGMNDEPDATWIIPSSLTSEELSKSAEVVGQHERNPKLDYGNDDNPIAAQDLLRRKVVHKPRAEYDDDSENENFVDHDEEDFLFPAGGPTLHKSDALENLKQKRRRRRHKDDDAEALLDEETQNVRRKAREDANLEKRKKIKSALFVHDSDDEEDEERDRLFFAQEEERRRGLSMKVAEALRSGGMEGEEEEGGASTGKCRKRKMGADGELAKGKRRKSSALVMDDDDLPVISGGSSSPTHTGTLENSEVDAAETPLSSPHSQSLGGHGSDADVGGDNTVGKPSITKAVSDIGMDDKTARGGFIVDSDSEDAAPITKPVRTRARAGFIIDSDTE